MKRMPLETTKKKAFILNNFRLLSRFLRDVRFSRILLGFLILEDETYNLLRNDDK
jgi:hypothetical protein